MQITNYYDHPSDNRYMVYQFYVPEHADAFEAMLVEKNIQFERFLDEEGERPRILFGVHKTHKTRSNHANFIVHAKYRSPFIPNVVLRYSVLIITIFMIAMAIIGYIKSAE